MLQTRRCFPDDGHMRQYYETAGIDKNGVVLKGKISELDLQDQADTD